MTINGIWIPILFIAFALVAQFLTKGFSEDDYKKVSREMDELKTCPFCGATYNSGLVFVYEIEGFFGVSCKGCGALKEPWCFSKESAIEAWNRRVPNELGK